MVEHDFHRYAIDYIQSIEQENGISFDVQFNGRSISDAFHLDASPSVAAILRTELALGTRVNAGTRVHFDLKELSNVTPPAGDDNLFVTFTANSAGYPEDEGMAFGLHFSALHFTDLQSAEQDIAGPTPGDDPCQDLNSRIFHPGERLGSCFSVMIYTLSASGEMGVATTRISIGLNPEGRLVAYGLSGLGTSSGPAAGSSTSSERIMLLLFLALSAFLLVNQGEAPLTLVGERKGVIG